MDNCESAKLGGSDPVRLLYDSLRSCRFTNESNKSGIEPIILELLAEKDARVEQWARSGGRDQGEREGLSSRVNIRRPERPEKKPAGRKVN